MRESKFSNNSFFKKFHKNNSGATLVVVLIVVAFIAVLGSVAIAGAMVNLKMKVVDKKAKKTFYSCEEAVDEIYSELGMVSMDALEAAYIMIAENEISDIFEIQVFEKISMSTHRFVVH